MLDVEHVQAGNSEEAATRAAEAAQWQQRLQEAALDVEAAQAAAQAKTAEAEHAMRNALLAETEGRYALYCQAMVTMKRPSAFFLDDLAAACQRYN